jgi:integrase-like protein
VTASSFAWIGASGVRLGPAAGLRATATEGVPPTRVRAAGTPRDLVRLTVLGLGTGVNVHTLRHTLATAMLEKAVPRHTVADLLGHSDIPILAQVYAPVVVPEPHPSRVWRRHPEGLVLDGWAQVPLARWVTAGGDDHKSLLALLRPSLSRGRGVRGRSPC